MEVYIWHYHQGIVSRSLSPYPLPLLSYFIYITYFKFGVRVYIDLIVISPNIFIASSVPAATFILTTYVLVYLYFNVRCPLSEDAMPLSG